MAIDRENSGGVFHNHLPALVEAEHARDVSVLLGTVPDFWLVDLMGKIIPYHAGKLDANTDIHLVVFQRNTVLRTPFGKKAAAHTADGKNDMLRRDAVLYAFAFIMHSMSGFVHIGHVGIRQNGYMFLQKAAIFRMVSKLASVPRCLSWACAICRSYSRHFFFSSLLGMKRSAGAPKCCKIPSACSM